MLFTLPVSVSGTGAPSPSSQQKGSTSDFPMTKAARAAALLAEEIQQAEEAATEARDHGGEDVGALLLPLLDGA